MQKPIFCHLFECLNQIQVLGAHLDMRCLTSGEKTKNKTQHAFQQSTPYHVVIRLKAYEEGGGALS